MTELAFAAGSRQLIAGQVADLEAEGKKILARRVAIHPRMQDGGHDRRKPQARRDGRQRHRRTSRCDSQTSGITLGLAFQVIDDILDVTQTSEKLGKSAGKDVASQKTTYPALSVSRPRARKPAASLRPRTRRSKPFGAKAARLARTRRPPPRQRILRIPR